MIIYCLFGQRKESYEGQYAPELIDSVDEYTNDENPDYLNNRFELERKNPEFSNIAIIPIEISQKEVIKRLSFLKDIIVSVIK